jgi:aminopeptidase N
MISLLPVLVAGLLGSGVLADDDVDCASGRREAIVRVDRSGEVDPETGRDALNYPPHRDADFLHMTLRLVIPDMNVAEMTAEQTLRFEAIGTPLERLTLDAKVLDVESIRCDLAETAWTYDGRAITITFDPPLPTGEPATLITTYTVNDPPDGLIWTLADDAWPGRPAQIHTQGQPETNSYWFPCHDFPHERLTTELIVTVPSGFLVSSNGHLAEHSVDDSRGDASQETFHWVQDKAHPNYLVTLIVGKFDVVDIGSPALPMPVYVPPGRGPDVEGTYGRTAEMISLYEGLFDEPYPWDRYAQLLVWNFGSGGMENTSATTLYDTAVLDEQALIDQSIEGLIAHELGHQWFGDLMTCRSWEHIWLNEGFATYLELLWMEHLDGEDGYQAEAMANFRAVIDRDEARAPEVPGMVSKVYEHPWDVFDRAADPYAKGASILHMLRRKLGDEVFFRSVAAYIDRFKEQSVETNDLRKVMEEVSGEALAQFFDQWCLRPGVPHLDVDIDWNDGASTLDVVVTQTQPIDGYNPAYVFDLPIWIKESGRAREAVMHVDARTTRATFQLEAEPSIVAIDPDLNVLAELSIDQPVDRWYAQLEAGPTLTSRVQAARELGGHDAEATLRRLVSVAHDERMHDMVREEAMRSLAALGASGRLFGLLREGIADHQVRRACIEQLARALEEDDDVPAPEARDAFDTIAAHAERDESQLVRAAAIRAIATLSLIDWRSIVIEATRTDSQHDRLRRAGLEALATLDAAEGLEIAIDLAGPGHYSRTRATAIETISALAHHAPNQAYDCVAPLLRDRDRRVWEAAAEALVEMGDPRGVEALDAFAESVRDPIQKEAIGERRDRLAEKVEG